MSVLILGDVVQLKSGSPEMTICDIDDYSLDSKSLLSASCTWFDGNKAETRIFPFHALVKAAP